MDSFTPVIGLHAVAALYVLLLGPFQILRRRRDTAHRIIGASWVVSMLVVCISSFWIMPHGFTWLHGLSIWTLISLAMALVGVRLRIYQLHMYTMVFSYIGTAIAFVFASIIPGRLIPEALQHEPLVVAGTVLGVLALATIFVVVTLRATAAGRERCDAPAGSVA